MDKETDKKSKKVKANEEVESNSIEYKKVAEKKTEMKDKKDGDKGEKSNESAVVGNNTKCLELAAIIQSCGYSRISHTIPRKNNQTKIIR